MSIITAEDKKTQFFKLKTGELIKKGLSTGFESLDENIKLAKGFLAIISGYPGSGKSEWLDSVLLNMALQHEWKTLYFSPENHPVEQHMCKLAEKYIGKNITYFENKDNQTALDFMQNAFAWVDPEKPSLDNVIKLAEQKLATTGLDCLVIDPWNAITHSRGGELLHEYLSEALSKIIRFSRSNDVLICVVAHPKNPVKNKEGGFDMPTLYDISDGAMWRNKADYGVICHRPDMGKNEMIVSVQKLKNKWMGTIGMKTLDYDWRSGRFKDKQVEEFTLPSDSRYPF